MAGTYKYTVGDNYKDLNAKDLYLDLRTLSDAFTGLAPVQIGNSYNLIGAPGRLVFYNGGQTIFLHDGRGNDADLSPEKSSFLLDATGILSKMTLAGGAFGDRLIGGLAADTLIGNEGDDFLQGAAGADVLHGGDGTDTASYSTSSGRVTVDLAIGSGFDNDADGDTLDSIENLAGSNFADVLRGDAHNNVLMGGDGNDTLRGRDGDDTLAGNDGNDVLVGGAGADTMIGGTGNDKYYVIDFSFASGGDRVVENADEGTDIVYTSVDFSLGDNVEQLRASADAGRLFLSGNELDNLIIGGTSKDLIFGERGNDKLLGGAGDDSLRGGKGVDNLYGGTGNDRFLFASPEDSNDAFGRDRIRDFADGDKIDLRPFKTDNAEGHFLFSEADHLTKTAGELFVVTKGRDSVVFGDADGDGNVDLAIYVTNHKVVASDFLFEDVRAI